MAIGLGPTPQNFNRSKCPGSSWVNRTFRFVIGQWPMAWGSLHHCTLFATTPGEEPAAYFRQEAIPEDVQNIARGMLEANQAMVDTTSTLETQALPGVEKLDPSHNHRLQNGSSRVEPTFFPLVFLSGLTFTRCRLLCSLPAYTSGVLEASLLQLSDKKSCFT